MRISLKSISGDLLNLELEPSSLVADLISQASKHWQVPAQCVKLVIDTRTLCEDETCGSLCEDGNADVELCVSMLVSLDRLCQALIDERVSRNTKIENLKVLCSMGTKGKAAIDAVSTLLEHQQTVIRLAAVEALIKIGRDDSHAIGCASELLTHRMQEVRQTGIRALAKLADRGDVTLVQAVTSHLLQPQSPPVKAAALQALSTVAEVGDEDTVALVSAFMLDEDSAVRFQAVQSMSKLARRADVRAIATTLDCLDDEDWHVRLAAVSAISMLAENDRHILTAMERMMQDDVDVVRNEAAMFLSKFATSETETHT